MLAVFIAGTGPDTAYAQDAQPTPSIDLTSHNSIALTRLENGYYTLPVRLEGQGPWPFVIDTGASHSLIASSIAQQFGYVPLPPTSDVQTLTEQYRGETFQINRVSLGPVQAPALNMVIADVPEDNLPLVVGLLGADLFDRGGPLGQLTRIDFPNQKIDFEPPALEHADAIISDRFNLIFGTGIAGRSQRTFDVLVDTGSPFTIINSTLARQIEGFDTINRLGVSDFAMRLQMDDAVEMRVSRVQIGGLCVGPVYVVEADVDVFRALGWARSPAMILGTDVLSQAQITIDRASGQVQIEQVDAPGRLCRSRRIQRIETGP